MTTGEIPASAQRKADPISAQSSSLEYVAEPNGAASVIVSRARRLDVPVLCVSSCSKRRVKLFGSREQFARRHRHAIGQRAVERFRSGGFEFRALRHVGDNQFRRVDRVMLVRLDLRQFVEPGLRQVALFEIENAIIAEQENGAGFLRFRRRPSRLPSDRSSRNTMTVLCSPLRTLPPSSLACFSVNQNGETYLLADNKKWLMPR